MTDTGDIDMLAAEYVLGTLDAAARSSVALRRMTDGDLDSKILEWTARLAPLNMAVPSLAPPPTLEATIMALIFGATAGDRDHQNVVALTRRAARWRAAAIGASALAACLAGVIVYQATLQPMATSSYVAVLQKDAQSPAFLMTVDIARRTLTVRPVAAEPQKGKSYELWLVNEKLGAPRSLGIVGDKPFSNNPTLAAYAPAEIENAVYAISLEPEGGSRTGAPTGPVLFTGKLVQAKP